VRRDLFVCERAPRCRGQLALIPPRPSSETPALGLRQDGDEHGAGGFDRGGGHVGFDRGLTGPGLEGEEPAGLLAVFEQRIMLAAGLLPGAGDHSTRSLRPSFPAPPPAVLTAFGSGKATEPRFLVTGVAGINRCLQPCASLIR
jgi:hypothetical protein